MSYPGKTRDVQGIVLGLQDTGDRDQVVFLLKPDGLESIYARGVQSPASRNRRLVQPGSQVQLVTTDHGTGRMESLIHGDLIQSYAGLWEDLLTGAQLSFLTDILRQTRDPEQLYYLYEKLLKVLRDEPEKKYLWLCYFLRTLLVFNGIAPYTDGCVACGKTAGIETLSLQEGGFLCRSCNAGRYPVMEKEELKKYRYLFAAGEDNLPFLEKNTRWTSQDFLFLARWQERYSGLDFPSLQFLRSVSKLEK